MRVTQFGLLLTALAGLALTAPQASALPVGNPSFEDPITYEGTTFTDSWEGFSGGGTAFAANSPLSPRTGSQSLITSITAADNNYAGAFQDVIGVVPGTTVFFSVWQKAQSLPFNGADTEQRIEWRKVGQGAEVGRTPNLVTSALLTTDYQKFTVSGVVPAGADTARIVFALQTFSGGAANTGVVFVDDATLVVPEPATCVLGAVAAVAFAGLRRRRS